MPKMTTQTMIGRNKRLNLKKKYNPQLTKI